MTKSEIADFQDEGYLLDRPTVCWRRSYDGLCDKRKNCLVTENSSGIGQGIDTILVSSYTTGADILIDGGLPLGPTKVIADE